MYTHTKTDVFRMRAYEIIKKSEYKAAVYNDVLPRNEA